MRFCLVILLVCFLVGCQNTQLKLPLREHVPATVLVEDVEQRVLGLAISLGDGVYVTPDHLLTNGDLLVSGTLIEILARDFDHDVLFFRVAENLLNPDRVNSLSDSPPVVGKSYYRFGVDGFQTMNVANIGGDFSLGGENQKKNLIVFEGIIQPGESGTPVFGIDGTIYSMLIAADIPKGLSYGVRSDILLELYRDQVSD